MILHKEEILWGMGGHLPSFPNLLIGPNAVTPTRVSALANIKYVDISRRMQIEVLQSELLSYAILYFPSYSSLGE